MAISHHHLEAVLTPAGRVTPVAYFMLFVPLLALDFALMRAVTAVPVAERHFDVVALAMPVVLWMQYCLLSRRRQDIGESGLPLLLFLAIALVCWVKTVEPGFLDPGLPSSHRLAKLMPHVHHAGRMLAVVLFLTYLAQAGTDGPNRFGQEFGESSDRVSRWRTETVMGALHAESAMSMPVPQQPAKPVKPTSDEIAARRRRQAALPLPSEMSGARRGNSAFGRR